MKNSETLNKSIILVLILAVIMTFSFGVLAVDTADAATKKTHLKETKIVLVEGQKFTEKLISSSGKTISASKVKWSSSAKSVAKVSSKGVITAVKDGTATITAKYSGKKYTAKVYVYDKMQADYDEIYNAAQAEHKALTETNMSKIDMSKYESPNAADKDLITDAEAKSLTVRSDKIVSKVTAEAALDDVDLLFRTLKSAYAGYYYFGEENFKKAEANLNKWISGKTTVKTHDLKKKIREELSFMKDSGSYVALRTETLEDFDYEYYYCTNQQFSKDEKGYYKTAKGTKWYFQSFSDSRVTMEPTLTQTGDVVYSPVLLCPEAEKKSCKAVLKNSKGSKRTETITWKLNETYAQDSVNKPQFVFAEEDNIAYIAVRSFNKYYDDELNEYVLTAAKAKDAEVLILDMRSNGGGDMSYANRFFKELTGEELSYPVAVSDRSSRLDNQEARKGFSKGIFADNDVKIIVLTDGNVAYGGENYLLYSRACDNVMAVGSNTAGTQLSSSGKRIYLPDTRIEANINSSLTFVYGQEQADGIGFMPDVWCNPEAALDCVFNMLENNGIASESTFDKLRASVEKQESKIAADDSPHKDPGITNLKREYTADAADYLDGTSNYVYVREDGEIILKIKTDRDSSKKVAGAIFQISQEPVIKPTDRTYRLDEQYGQERKIDMLSPGKTYYARMIVTYVVDGKNKDERASETFSFTAR